MNKTYNTLAKTFSHTANKRRYIRKSKRLISRRLFFKQNSVLFGGVFDFLLYAVGDFESVRKQKSTRSDIRKAGYRR